MKKSKSYIELENSICDAALLDLLKQFSIEQHFKAIKQKCVGFVLYKNNFDQNRTIETLKSNYAAQDCDIILDMAVSLNDLYMDFYNENTVKGKKVHPLIEIALHTDSKDKTKSRKYKISNAIYSYAFIDFSIKWVNKYLKSLYAGYFIELPTDSSFYTEKAMEEHFDKLQILDKIIDSNDIDTLRTINNELKSRKKPGRPQSVKWIGKSIIDMKEYLDQCTVLKADKSIKYISDKQADFIYKLFVLIGVIDENIDLQITPTEYVRAQVKNHIASNK